MYRRGLAPILIIIIIAAFVGIVGYAVFKSSYNIAKPA